MGQLGSPVNSFELIHKYILIFLKSVIKSTFLAIYKRKWRSKSLKAKIWFVKNTTAE